MKSKSIIFRTALIVAMGGMLFGFDTAVISGVELALKNLYNLSPMMQGLTVAIALIGTIVGALVSGAVADKIGRKKALLIVALMFVLTEMAAAFSTSWEMFIIARFIGGIGIGATSVIGPLYIAEIAPAEMRGRLVALFQLNVVTGLVLAFVSNYTISVLVEGETWRWMVGVPMVLSVTFFILLLTINNTPRWLLIKGKVDKAVEVLTRFGYTNVANEIEKIESSLESHKNFGARLFVKQLRYPLILAFLMAFFNQFSGINAIMYYAPRIFEMAGVDHSSALMQSIAVALTNMVFTLLALTFIDKYGRKKLLMIGSIGMFVTLGIVALSFFSIGIGSSFVLIGLILFIAFFASSQGAVIWVFISEIFPNKVRGKGQTFGSLSHWVLAALISWVFPFFASGNQMFTGIAFAFFAVTMLAQFFVVKSYFPETKGKTLEEIENLVLR